MQDSATAGPARGRRGLGPGLTAFLVVDALLVLAVLVALAAYLSGGDDGPDPAPGAASSAPATPADGATAGPDDVSLDAFALPSGNIACEISEGSATCTIAESAAAPVELEGCAGVAGPVLTVTAEGASTPCVQGALPGPAAPGTPVLEYGASTTVGDFTCASATTGVTCRHEPTGAGFRLARAGHEILPATA